MENKLREVRENYGVAVGIPWRKLSQAEQFHGCTVGPPTDPNIL